MYRTILLPLDGSPLSEQSIPYAIAVARAAGARVLAVRSADDELLDLEDPATGRLYTVDPADQYLDDVRARLSRSGVAAETEVLYLQAPDAILTAAQDHAVNLIVMATHGRSGVGRWLFGSVADAVLRSARVPVLMVPPGSAQPWRDDLRFRAAVALDGSAHAEGVLPFACELARTMLGELTLVRIVEPSPAAPSADGARGYLEATAHRVRAHGIGVSIAVRDGAAARGLTGVADDWRCGVIAMATHGRDGLTRLVLGSVATETLRLAHMPLLLVPPLAVRALKAIPPSAPGAMDPLTASDQPVTDAAGANEPALARR